MKVPEETLAASPRPASPGHRCPHLVGRSRPQCRACPHASPPGRGTRRPQGPSRSRPQAPAPTLSAGQGPFCHTATAARHSLGPGSAQSRASLDGARRFRTGGSGTESGCCLRHSGPPRGAPRAQDYRDSALRGKGLRRSQEHLGRRAGSACEAVPLFGAGAGEPKWILQKVIKDDRSPCLWHSTKAISQNSRNVPQESPVPGTEAAGAGRRGRGRRGQVPSPLLTPVCASAQQQQ